MRRILLTLHVSCVFDANAAILLDNYIRKVLLADEDWPSDFDDWDPQGREWGWLTQSRPESTSPCAQETTITLLPKLMAKHGFRHFLTHWGEHKYEFEPRHAISRNLASIMSPKSDYCMVCSDLMCSELTATTLPCDHVYHRGCILIWLAQDGRCPICRRFPDQLHELRTYGNDSAKLGRFHEAVKFYSECLFRLDSLTDNPELRIALHSNMALMYLRLKLWNEAKWSALQALKVPAIKPVQTAKAKYRLGLAEAGLEKWESAQHILEEASLYAPADRCISKALAEVKCRAKGCS
ncbi:cyclophilin type peptidyl-prolyl cis-trans isomerase/CLD [Penicillium canescens]|uniref:Cyclophilin type peptidyl-prolyl cis-trans isomerase/CLD n=1 Tax=Penicillium canescens TaxID=5083 RepID=A0AAD6I633_PENCN|nr:cyclophilin type peptidyl-prolyl cis-trans isomerase/CLD [Penicillium canescens]KAJ6018460.1 cyclophilin type peptidyl-prolyl cis-trans isomerase/CLD [Penicillium canescens]KAJ6034098.1 cyclophilin type peptidyl-prolyl cis-trans isomerase/CLD [Penicillium canescens]KAJ6039337.1 cyclophilin type peptidyl-prolyl cis-trans isomerase/CLD [Penicillium canescens]KAJ6066177.1 cyclophilin type peptidyl-prolyl cis-trans isomerase/CLD [Penicillium canescens]KAJ6091029.1 cyclophilin type peptidyl-prol